MPDRTVEQRMAALERANAIRSYRSLLKRNVKDGHVAVCDVLADPTPEIASMHVADLIGASPKIGAVKTRAIMRRCGISTRRTIAGLSERQRRELCQALS